MEFAFSTDAKKVNKSSSINDNLDLYLNDLHLCNGNLQVSFTKSLVEYKISNTCTIDYFLLVLKIASINNNEFLKSFDNEIIKNIVNFIDQKNWNFARLLWLQFNKSHFKNFSNLIYYDCYGSEEDFYGFTFRELSQEFFWKSKCDNTNKF